MYLPGFAGGSLETYEKCGLDGKLKFARELKPVIAWREGSTFVRPKWGIYGSLEQKDAIAHKEEKVRFANFSIQEWTDIPRQKLDEEG